MSENFIDEPSTQDAPEAGELTEQPDRDELSPEADGHVEDSNPEGLTNADVA